MKKLFMGAALVILAGGIYTSCFLFYLINGNISDEDYRRMSQEIVNQKVQSTPNFCEKFHKESKI